MPTLINLLGQGRPIHAPLAFNPLSARLAEQYGADALYLGGGALGYLQVGTEANLGVVEMAQVGLQIRAKTKLPLILDGQCGWGDAMHLSHATQVADAAGFDAIEIEDQIVPKRAHHHVGIEHLIPLADMVEKVRTAVSSRRREDLLVIARTNAGRENLDEALRRGEAMRRAGADMLFVLAGKPSDLRTVGERLGGPLMFMAIGARPSGDMSIDDLYGLGYRLFVDSMSPAMAIYQALEGVYHGMQRERGQSAVFVLPEMGAIQKRIHETIDINSLLEIERRTVESAGVAAEARGHWDEKA